MGFWVNSSERSMSESEGSADLGEGRGCEPSPAPPPPSSFPSAESPELGPAPHLEARRFLTAI